MKGMIVTFIGLAVMAALYVILTGDLNQASTDLMQSTTSAGSIVP